MPQPTLNDYLKYANLQLAAEALYGSDATIQGATLTPGATYSGPLALANLTVGNHHASKFAASEASDVSGWTVVQHISNTGTGFSGTLFKNNATNELVLSFRSTEFVDDAARDSVATNLLEIKETGWAFGQISDMEDWYQSLNSRHLIDGPFTVTGYSLGGHLATAFNLMHGDDARLQQVITFNGAGVGTIGDGSLATTKQQLPEMIRRFLQLRAQASDPSGLEGLLVSSEGKAVYRALRSALETSKGVPDQSLIATVDGLRLLEGLPRADYDFLSAALTRALRVKSEADYVPTLDSGSVDQSVPERPANVQHLAPDQTLAIAAESLDYQMAVLAAKAQFNANSLSLFGGFEGTVGEGTPGQGAPLANQFDLAGTEMDTSQPLFMVAHSQYRYGNEFRLFIEDQPLTRGDIIWQSVKESFGDFAIRLLVPNYTRNAFGDTHSLVLIIDSLSVQNALLQLVPDVQRPTSTTTLNDLLKAASYVTKQVDSNDGTAEGDVLENVVNALADLILGPASGPRLDGSLNGNTWWSVPDIKKDGRAYTGREALYRLLKDITDAPSYKSLAGHLTLSPATANLATAARDDFGAFAALYSLSPFVLRSADGSVDLGSAVGDAWKELYADWAADKAAKANGDDASTFKISDQWLADRANFLERKSWFNQQDIQPANPQRAENAEAPFLKEDTFYVDMASGYKIAQGFQTTSPFANIQRYYFGDSRPDYATGGFREDHLYTGAGGDLLVGQQGDDHLEGGAGLDVYQYNASSAITDAGNDGTDEILDSDGLGVVRYSYRATVFEAGKSTVIGGLALRAGDTRWESPDGKYTYERQDADLVVTIAGDAGGSVRILNFDFEKTQSEGYLGIRLADTPPAAPQSPVRTFLGDKADWDSDAEQEGVQTQTDAYGNVLRADGQGPRPDIAETDRADSFNGSAAGEVEFFQTAGGDDTVYADGAEGAVSEAGGRDIIEAGEGRDVVAAGGGDDWIEGGGGADILAGGFGNDTLYADTSNNETLTIAQAIDAGARGPQAEGRGELLAGQQGNDILIGAATADLLLGGADNDLIVGGSGADNIYGDASLSTADRGWSVSRSSSVTGDLRNYRIDGAELTFITTPDVGGMDVIYGGAGADWVFGGAGNDFIVGGDTEQDADVEDDVLFGEAGSDVLLGGSGNDFLAGDSAAVDAAGLSGEDFLDGGAGEDVLQGGKGNDTLIGGDGDAIDTLIGGDGDDLLWGGAGNDILMGGAGKDVYLYNRGDGEDVITDPDIANGSQYLSAVVLGPGISKGDVKFRLGSLKIDLGGGDAIHLEGFDPNDPLAAHLLGTLQFADGTNITYEEILDQGFDLDGTEGDDVITGTAVTDRIDGKGGNDTLIGIGGDDSIVGGTGDDDLLGGDGNDVLDGGHGSDTLDGGEGDDALTTGDGADIAFGGAGNDTINAGDGDLVVDVQGTNHLDLTAYTGLTADNLELTQYQTLTNETYLNFHIRDAANPGVTPATGGVSVQYGELGYFASVTVSDGAGGTVELANERVLGGKTTTGLFYRGLSAAETLAGTPFDDTMVGGGGADTINGNGGDDRIDGGSGDDTLAGGAGNDTYLLAYNGERDTVIEDGSAEPGSTNTIQLGQGIDPAKVRAIRIGDNLEVGLHATGDILVLKDFYIQPLSWQAGWQVKDDQAVLRPLADFVVPDSSTPETWLADQKALFLERRSDAFGANRIAEGAERVATDVYRQVLHTPSYSFGQTTTVTTTSALTSEVVVSDDASIFAGIQKSRQQTGSSSVMYVLGTPLAAGGTGGRLEVTSSFGNGTSTSGTNDGFVQAGIGAQDIQPGQTFIPIYIPQQSNLLRDQQSANYGSSGGYENPLDWMYSGQLVYAEGATPASGAFLNPITAVDHNVFISKELHVTDLQAGDSDNFLNVFGSAVEAGGGNDEISLGTAGIFVGPDWETALNLPRGSRGGDLLGGFVDAGAGDDVVYGGTGSDAIAGNDGADTIDGGRGSDTYLFTADEVGIDRLDDTGSAAYPYLEWLYRSQGIENWEERIEHANQWKVFIEEGRREEYFDTLEEANQFAADNEIFVPTISFIERAPAAPVIARNDTAALQHLVDVGLLDRDIVKFGPGITIDDLALTVTVNTQTQLEHPEQPWYDSGELSVRWGLAGFDTYVPEVNFGFGGTDVSTTPPGGDPEGGYWGYYMLGDGIELFQFADGSTYTPEQILERATVQTANMEYLVHRGSGDQEIPFDYDTVLFKDGIRMDEVTITRDGRDLLFKLNDGSTQARVSGYYGDPENVPEITALFADQPFYDAQYAGLNLSGTAGDDTLVGLPDFVNQLDGKAGNDVLVAGDLGDLVTGGAGYDIVVGGLGNDDLEDSEGNNTIEGRDGDDYIVDAGHAFVAGGAGDDYIQDYGPGSVIAFNAGDGNDTVYAGGALTLSLGGGLTPADLSLSIDGDDLVLSTATDSVRFAGGFGFEATSWPTITLQMFGSVHTYDFNALIEEFATQSNGDPFFSLSLGGVLQAHETSTSETEALGGAIAWQYGSNGNTSGLSNAQILAVLQDPSFGTAPQSIMVAGNQAPTLLSALADQTANEDSAFAFSVPAATFSDADAGDTLSYSATLPDGSALPAWLSFDTATQSFFGTPGHGDAGRIDVKVVATDGGGLTASDQFTITVVATAGMTLVGTDAADVLVGGSGNDTLDGGSGADTMIGALGDDTYFVQDAGDEVIENLGEGVDKVVSSISYALPDNVEKLALGGTAAIDGTGNLLSNVVTGNGSANVIDGGAGADSMVGGAGDDTYIVENGRDRVVEKEGEGDDAVLASVAYRLPANVENLVLTGTSGIRGTGNGLANTLTGNSAGNVLDGGAGGDTLIGGAGSDTYIVDDAADLVVENGDEGTDTVRAAISYALPDNVENVVLTGSVPIDATGNVLSNVLTGNTAANALSGGEGNDTLKGGAGADVLAGGAGNDTYVIDDVSAVVVENVGEGTDTVKASVSYALAQNVEKLVLTGAAAINGTGNALDNVLNGNAAPNVLSGGDGNDTLNGAGGADTLVGGGGDDVYVVSTSDVTIVENLAEGIDTVKSSVDYSLGANLENLTLTGTADLIGVGNTLDNILRGNTGANLLQGGDGDDTLVGNLANDVLQGGAGNDRLSDSAGNNLLDGGSGADILVGNAGSQLFAGGSGNDTVKTGTGADVIAFNRGDGQDTVAASQGRDNTVSLGGGISYADLAFRKVGASLVLQTGIDARTGLSEQLTMSGWYSTSADNRSVGILQVIAASMPGFDPASTDPLLAKKVQKFDFAGLVAAFDAARAVNPKLTTWLLSNALAQNALGGSDDLAIGGDLAYRYGERGSFAGMALDDARGALAATEFAAREQVLTPVMEGGTGADTLRGSSANTVLAGDEGADILTGGQGNDFLAGGAGDDIVNTGAGVNIVGFNAGDGTDAVYSDAASVNALSLGGGISYDDLSLSRDGDDLVLNAGNDDHILLKDWYAGKDDVTKLQIILDATPVYDPASSDPLYVNRVETFDFRGLVSAFDQAQAASPGLTSWEVTNALLENHLGGSDDSALGGEIAYGYAHNGSFAGIGLQAAQQAIGAPEFGSDAQTLRPFTGLQDGLIRLS